ncbi:hypothetical protein HYH02_007716 [Chlamydomonas schloesseri]|uniref:Extradiol ring-cleavage dioxygenase class III enzyme subunit B domain-containing protein n=1 Tax=Chlamydomonas schloesseri TaxID=2026947 RepID=A0A835WH21_9CHLO|nr:hypothetical protein HYH02_007716 [Chlamydomonas schloesseri]|eukprot:KAG2447388.1 hypothetical protein HYH02_007716 [Chlamydomonas schloesseri]
MEPLARSHGGLLALPQELLQAIVTGLPRGGKFILRSTCKSISRSLALSCSTVIVRRSALARRSEGAKNEVLAALDSPCWGPLLESVLELELGDVSHSVAADQGAFNTLLHGQHLRARTDALVALAVSFPNLRRLSISAACFSAGGLAALASLTKLESLSLDGSLECPGGTKQAADVYRQLLPRLQELRQLRLPQAVPACGAALDESDEEAEFEQEQHDTGMEEQEDEEDEVMAASRRHAAARGSSSLFTSDLAFPLLHSPLRAAPPQQHQQPPLSPRLPPPASPAQLPEMSFPASPIPQPAALVPPALPRRAPARRLDDLFGAGGAGGIRGSVLGAFNAPLSTGATPSLPQLPPLPQLPRLSMEPPINVADALAARASFGSSSASKPGAGRILFFNEGLGSGNDVVKAAEQEPLQQPQPQAPSRSSGTGFHPVPMNPTSAIATGVAAAGSASPVAPGAPAARARHVHSPRKPASYAAGFVFPPHLEELTIPLCALNRPVFEAVCAEFGQQPAGASAVAAGSASHGFGSSSSRSAGFSFGARAQPQPSIGRRVLSFPYLPALGGESAARSVATAGALAAWGADAATVAAISRPGSPVPSSSLIRTNSSLSSSLNNNSGYPGDQDLHATATSPVVLGAGSVRGLHAAHSRPGEADSGLRATATATSGISASSSGGSSAAGSTQQQQQESARPARRALRALHIPTLAGYSHWEGSFLRSARDFARLGGLGAELEVLHLSLELGSFRLTPENMRACLQHLSTLRGLRELRISEAQQPTCYSARKRSCSMRGAAAFGASGAHGLGSLSTASLERLGGVWPRLRSLHLFGPSLDAALSLHYAALEAGRFLRDLEPELVVMITPHGLAVPQQFLLYNDPRAEGGVSFEEWNLPCAYPPCSYSAGLDLDVRTTEKLTAALAAAGASVTSISGFGPPGAGSRPLPLGWAEVIPAYFIQRAYNESNTGLAARSASALQPKLGLGASNSQLRTDLGAEGAEAGAVAGARSAAPQLPRTVLLGLPSRRYERSVAMVPELLALGRHLFTYLDPLDLRVAFVISGDLAHTWSADGPYGFSAHAAKFDAAAQQWARQLDRDSLIKVAAKHVGEAKSCGFPGLVALQGVIDCVKPDNLHSVLLEYGHPLYYGMMCALFDFQGDA